MAKVSANQKYLGISSLRLKEQYESELVQYDALFQEYKESSDVNFNLLQKINDVHQNVTSLKYILIINISSYIEAIVNFYLAHRLTEEQFSSIESCKTIDKWVHVIGFLEPNYSLPKGEELYNLLSTLITTRNSIMHMKPKIENADGVIHKGNIPKHFENDHSDRNTIIKWASLPERLIDNLCSLDDSFSAKSTKLFSQPKFSE